MDHLSVDGDIRSLVSSATMSLALAPLIVVNLLVAPSSLFKTSINLFSVQFDALKPKLDIALTMSSAFSSFAMSSSFNLELSYI